MVYTHILIIISFRESKDTLVFTFENTVCITVFS